MKNFSQQRKQQRGQKAWKDGFLAEKIASLLLLFSGFRIVAKRYKTHVGEIDLIANRGKTLIFLEVKYRTSHQSALESIHYHQKKRIVQTAHHFLSYNPDFNYHNLRFDVIAFNNFFWPKHIKNAWDENLF